MATALRPLGTARGLGLEQKPQATLGGTGVWPPPCGCVHRRGAPLPGACSPGRTSPTHTPQLLVRGRFALRWLLRGRALLASIHRVPFTLMTLVGSSAVVSPFTCLVTK